MALTIWDPTVQQHVDVSRPKQASGSLLDIVSSVELELGGRGSVAMVVTNPSGYNGLASVDVSLDDGTTWVSVPFVNMNPVETYDAVITGISSSTLASGSGVFCVPIPSGATHVRVFENAGSSAPVDVLITATYGPAQPLPVLQMRGYGSAPSSISALRALTRTGGGLTTTAVAYTAGDVIGSTASLSMALASGAPLTLRSLSFKDDKNQKPGLQVLFFRSTPTGTYTNNAAVAPSTADMGALAGIVTVAEADWVTIQGTTKAAVTKQLDLPMGPSALALWMVVVVTSAPQYAANSTDLTWEAEFEQGA